METVRAFVGIMLPDSCQEIAAELTSRLGPLAGCPMSRTRLGNAHLTLRFLGNLPQDGPIGIDAVRRALGAVVFAPFGLRIAGGGFFPERGHPRVVWAGLAEGAEACRALAGAVDLALSALGFGPPDKPFAAHLTLARLRNPGRDGDWPAMLRLLTETVWPPVDVSRFVLCRSRLTAAGARYDVLECFPAREAC